MAVTTVAAGAVTRAAAEEPAAGEAAAEAGAVAGVGADGGSQLLRSSTAFSNGSAEKIGRHSPETCSAAEAFGTTRGSLTANVCP